MRTLEDAQQWLRNRMAKGAKCPCCGQFAKIYRRKLNSGLARNLLAMYRTAGTNWVDTFRDVPGMSHSVGDLHYWNLVESGESRNGVWRVTQLGEQFALGVAEVHTYVEVYNGALLGRTGDMISIRAALGAKFDYEELMGTPATVAPACLLEHDPKPYLTQGLAMGQSNWWGERKWKPRPDYCQDESCAIYKAQEENR